MKAVILAGGKGKRLAPYTTVLPKPLLPVGEMPILRILLQQLVQSGVSDVTLCIGYLGSLIQAYFGDGNTCGAKLSYSFENEPLGTAGPISLVKNLDEPFFVMNGDLLTTIRYDEMAKFHEAHGEIATIALARREVKIDFGVVEVGENNDLSNYIEKPSLYHYVSMGIYIFNPEILNYVEKGQRLDLPDLILRLIAKGRKVKTYIPECQWLDIGRPDDYQEANRIFEQNKGLFLKEATLEKF